MKILSNRHPDRSHLVVVDEVPFYGPMDITNWAPIHLVQPQWKHITIQPKPALDYIDVSKLVQKIQTAMELASETKITDFGDGEFTVEMWMKVPVAVREIDVSVAVINDIKENAWCFVDGQKP